MSKNQLTAYTKTIIMIHKVSDTQPAANEICEAIRLNSQADRPIILLLCGGSNIKTAIKIFSTMERNELKVASISLTDERFGPIGHKDSNWQQLVEAGAKFNVTSSHPLLTDKLNREQTAEAYASWLNNLVNQKAYFIALFGVGADGHTAGLLPHNPALGSAKMAVEYQAGDYERISIGPEFFQHIDHAVVAANDDSKWPILEALDGTADKPVADMPAMLLHRCKALVLYYIQ